MEYKVFRNNFLKIIVLCILVLASSNMLLGKSLKKEVNADRILKEIDQKGAKSVVRQLLEEDLKLWEFMMNQIEQGDEKWLKVAKKIEPGVDASSAIGLNFSVARALPKATKQVLELIGNEFNINDICTIPFIETDLKIEKAYLFRTKEALENPFGSKLEKKRIDCLSRIQSFIDKYY